jgi:hypothetical protein
MLLGGALAFGLAGAKKNHASAAAARPPVELSIPNSQPPLPEKATSEAAGALNVQGPASGNGANPAGQTPSNIKTEEVDFSREFNIAPAPDDSLSSSSETDATPPDDTPASPVVAPSKLSEVKAHSGAHVSKSAPQRTKSTAYVARSSPERGLPLPVAFGGDPPASDQMNGQESLEAKPQTASVLPAASPAPAHKPAEAKPEPKTEQKAEPKPEQTVSFLEVGSFNDATWADRAVERLTQLGYHAVSMHRTHLWMQSFHVQVGPYADAKDLAAAKQSLTSQGFKPHLVK